jgi:hypothetical protein
LSPDTSLLNSSIIGLIRSAKKSICVEQFYINKYWKDRCSETGLYRQSSIGCNVV